MILFMTRFRLLGRYLQSLYALKYFIAILFAYMTGKHMEIGQLLNREAAEAYLHQCRNKFPGRPPAAP